MSRNNSHDMKVARRRSRAPGQRSCPSCGSAPGLLPPGQGPSGQVMTHQEDCQLTAALAEVSEEHGSDAGFFAANPGQRYFSRPVTPQEIVEQSLAWPHDPPVSRSARVMVVSLGPDLRARVVYGVSRLN